MLRRQYEPDWERWSLYSRPPRNIFQTPDLSPIRESGELAAYVPAQPEDSGPLPELVIEPERPRKRQWEDETKEYYVGLAKRMRKYYRHIFNVPKKKKHSKANAEDDESSDFEIEELKLLDPSFHSIEADRRPPTDSAGEDIINEIQDDVNALGYNAGDNNNIFRGNDDVDVTRKVPAPQRFFSSSQCHSDTFTAAGEQHDINNGTESDSTIKIGEVNASSVDTSSMEGAGVETIVVQALIHDPPKRVVKSTSLRASAVCLKASEVSKSTDGECTTDSDKKSERYLQDITKAVLNEAAKAVSAADADELKPDSLNKRGREKIREEATPNRQNNNFSSVSTSTEGAVAIEITTHAMMHAQLDEIGDFPETQESKQKNDAFDDVGNQDTSSNATLKSDGFIKTREFCLSRNVTIRKKSSSASIDTSFLKDIAYYKDPGDDKDQVTSVEDSAEEEESVEEEEAAEDMNNNTIETKSQGSDELNEGRSHQLERHSDRCSTTKATPDNSISPAEKSSKKPHSSEEETTEETEEAEEEETLNEMDVTEDELGHGANQDGSDDQEKDTDFKSKRQKLSTIAEVYEAFTTTESNANSEQPEEAKQMTEEKDAREVVVETERDTVETVGEDAREVEVMRKQIPFEYIESLHKEMDSETPERPPILPTRKHSLQLHDSPDLTDDEMNRAFFELSPHRPRPKTLGKRKRAFSFELAYEMLKRAKLDCDEKAKKTLGTAQSDDKVRDVGVMTENEGRDKEVQTKEEEKKKISEILMRDCEVQTKGAKFEDHAVQTVETTNEKLETSHEYYYSDGTFRCFFKFKKV